MNDEIADCRLPIADLRLPNERRLNGGINESAIGNRKSEIGNMTTLWQDIRYSIRLLLKNKAVTLVALVALALGIGANTAIFSVINAVVLKGLPYKDPDQLVIIWEKLKQVDEVELAPDDYAADIER